MRRVLPLAAAVGMAAVPASAEAKSHCRGKVACISAPGVQLNVDRVQLWGPTGSAVNGQALIVVWVDVIDQTGPKHPNTYMFSSPLSPGALDPNASDSYYVVDATHNINADYTNGCTFKTANPQTDDPYVSGPYGFTFDKVLYPHQRENHRAICFAVNAPNQGFRFVWYPNGNRLDNGKQSKYYSVRIPAARKYSGAPIPTN